MNIDNGMVCEGGMKPGPDDYDCVGHDQDRDRFEDDPTLESLNDEAQGIFALGDKLARDMKRAGY